METVPLYKYMSLRDEKKLEFFWDFLRDKHLYLTKPSCFNDPFDCDIGLSDFSLSANRNFRERVMDMSDRLGISCFTKKFDNVLMWSHYADNHSGIVFKVDISELDQEIQKRFYEVDYSCKWPSSKDHNDATASNKLISLFYSRKNSDWVYEEEVRLIQPINDIPERKIKFDKPSFIKAIYFGYTAPVSCDDLDKEDLYRGRDRSSRKKELIRNLRIIEWIKKNRPDIDVFQMGKGSLAYSLEPYKLQPCMAAPKNNLKTVWNWFLSFFLT